MKVLMIPEKDSSSMLLAPIAEEIIARGGEVRIYATVFNEIVLSYFSKDIPRFPHTDINEEVVEWCDIIYCSSFAGNNIPSIVLFAHKPIFTAQSFNFGVQILWGGDICFVPSIESVESDYNKILNYSFCGVGEPKFDNRSKTEEESPKRFLFIDSGHFPFSKKGKEELAKALLHICENYPDYELVIKPRFLPNDKIRTHRNSVHLYDVIRRLTQDAPPANLVMLDYHGNLTDLINRSRTVICMYTTGFVGAVLSGKGLVILDNIPSNDTYDIRRKTFKKIREAMAGTGALIDYRKADCVLPEGVKAKSDYLDYLLAEKENAASNIVDICEYLCENYYSKDILPHIENTDYHNYRRIYRKEEGMTWEDVIVKRCRDLLIYKLLDNFSFRINAEPDIPYVMDLVDQKLCSEVIIAEEEFRAIMDSMGSLYDQLIISSHSRLLSDDIDAGILLNSYYSVKNYDAIRNFPRTDISAYNMYRAFVAVEDEEEQDREESKRQLIEYFNRAWPREYFMEITDEPIRKFKAFMMLIDYLKEDGEKIETQKYINWMAEYYKEIYFTDVIRQEGNFNQKKRAAFIVDILKWLEHSEK